MGGRRGQRGLICLVNQSIKLQVHEIYNSQDGLYIIIKFNDQFFASVYVPPSLPDELLLTILDDILARTGGEVTILGDFNARVGSIVGDTTFNPRGRKLLEYLEDSELSIVVPEVPRFTCRNNFGGGVPDLVLSTSFEFTLHVDDHEHFGGSDHRPLRLCSPTQIIKDVTFERWDIARFKDDAVVVEYQNYLSVTVADLSSRMLNSNVDEAWSIFKLWIETAASQSIGKFHFKPHDTIAIWCDELRLLKQKMDAALKAYQENLDSGLQGVALNQFRIALIHTSKMYRVGIKNKKEIHFRKWCKKLGDPKATSLLLKTVRAIKMRKSGRHCALDVRKMNDHRLHFESTFGGLPSGCLTINQQMSLSDLGQNDRRVTFSLNEVSAAIKSLPNGKAPGCDSIWAELISNAPECITNVLHTLFNLINNSKSIPADWTVALVCPIFKMKGDIEDIKNYRPISLTCIVRRAYEKVLQRRMLPLMNKLSKYQGGFRPKRSTMDQCFILNELLVQHPNLQTILLDFRAAYDLVDRRILWVQLIDDYGCPSELVTLFQMLFDNNVSKLMVSGHHSDPILNQRGLLQGSSLSPILFNFFIDSLLQELDKRSSPKINTYGIRTNHLSFADDINLHATSDMDMRALLRICEVWSLRVGMEFSTQKCLNLVPELIGVPKFELYGHLIPVSAKATYLGVEFNIFGIDWPELLNLRKRKTLGVLQLFKSVGYSLTGFSQTSSTLLYKAFIRSSLEYGLALGPPPAIVKKYQSLQTVCLGSMFSCSRNTSANALHKLCLVVPISFRIQLLQAKFWGRLFNSTDANIPAVRFCWNGAGNAARSSMHTKIAYNDLWIRANKLNHFINQLTINPTLEEPVVAISLKSQQELSTLTIQALDHGNSNVAGCISIPIGVRKLKYWSAMSSCTFSSKEERVNILRWLTGNVCRHEPCRRCNGTSELSRNHALECTGNLESLSQTLLRIDVSVGNLNPLSRLLLINCFKLSTLFIHQTTSIINTIYRSCKGYSRIDNGHWLRPILPDTEPAVTEAQPILRLNPGRGPRRQNDALTSLTNQVIELPVAVDDLSGLEGTGLRCGGAETLLELPVEPVLDVSNLRSKLCMSRGDICGRIPFARILSDDADVEDQVPLVSAVSLAPAAVNLLSVPVVVNSESLDGVAPEVPKLSSVSCLGERSDASDASQATDNSSLPNQTQSSPNLGKILKNTLSVDQRKPEAPGSQKTEIDRSSHPTTSATPRQKRKLKVAEENKATRHCWFGSRPAKEPP